MSGVGIQHEVTMATTLGVMMNQGTKSLPSIDGETIGGGPKTVFTPLKSGSEMAEDAEYRSPDSVIIMHTETVQELIAAEREARVKINARKKEREQMKVRAVEEAKAEIAAYREEREHRLQAIRQQTADKVAQHKAAQEDHARASLALIHSQLRDNTDAMIRQLTESITTVMGVPYEDFRPVVRRSKVDVNMDEVERRFSYRIDLTEEELSLRTEGSVHSGETGAAPSSPPTSTSGFFRRSPGSASPPTHSKGSVKPRMVFNAVRATRSP